MVTYVRLCVVAAVLMVTRPLCTCMHDGGAESRSSDKSRSSDETSSSNETSSSDETSSSIPPTDDDGCKGDRCSPKLGQRVQPDSDPPQALQKNPSVSDSQKHTLPAIPQLRSVFNTGHHKTGARKVPTESHGRNRISGTDRPCPIGTHNSIVTSAEEGDPLLNWDPTHSVGGRQPGSAESTFCSGIYDPVASTAKPRADPIETLEKCRPPERPPCFDPLQPFYGERFPPVAMLPLQETSADVGAAAWAVRGGVHRFRPPLPPYANMILDPRRYSHGSRSTSRRPVANIHFRNGPVCVAEGVQLAHGSVILAVLLIIFILVVLSCILLN